MGCEGQHLIFGSQAEVVIETWKSMRLQPASIPTQIKGFILHGKEARRLAMDDLEAILSPSALSGLRVQGQHLFLGRFRGRAFIMNIFQPVPTA